MGEPSHLAFLFGDPVAHSLSPAIHNAAFNALGLDAEYRAIRISAEDLPEAVRQLRVDGVFGANVTIPHKEAILSLVDDLTPSARSSGAVNTVMVEGDGRLIGTNTDISGFLDPLDSHMEGLRGGSAVIFGAGGAGRAACYALLMAMRPSRLTIVARRRAQADQLIADVDAFDASRALRYSSFDKARQAVQESQLIVNATPVGMEPADKESPWPTSSDLHGGQLVFDLVYTPAETHLLRDAARRGAATISGKAMLLAQAAASFELWTGREMPMAAVRDALSDTF